MALTSQQIAELNIANTRVEAARSAGENLDSFATDIENIEYAKTKGFAPTVEAPAPADETQPTDQPIDTDPPVVDPAPTADPSQPEDQDQPDQTGIDALVQSNRVFNITDAKNYAYSKGESNFQKYIGGAGGQENPLYIGSTNFARLQQQYTSYQIEQATMRTNDGIYWRDGVNIGEVPRSDPADLANDDTTIISNLVSTAKGEADRIFGGVDDKDKISGDPDISTDVDENNDSILKMLQNQFGSSAESLYTELFKTPEMKTAQADVIDKKNQLDQFDQQLDELKDDIRAEVEGEASESYINSLATIRGNNILKQKRSVQRDYDTALAQLNGLKDEANNLLNVRVKDADTRYNRMFSMLQLQLQEEGKEFNQELAILNASMMIPEGRTIQVGGTTIKGLKENDNLNVVQFTDAERNTYVIGVDKVTGAEMYKTFLGKAAATGGGTTNNFQYQYKELEAETKLGQLKAVTSGLNKPINEVGAIRTDTDDDGNTYYYNAYALDQAEKNKVWWRNDKVDSAEHILFYAK